MPADLYNISTLANHNDFKLLFDFMGSYDGVVILLHLYSRQKLAGYNNVWAMSCDEWKRCTGLRNYPVNKTIKSLEDRGILETRVKWNDSYTPTKHFKLNVAELYRMLEEVEVAI